VTQLNESQLFELIQSVQLEDPVLKDLLREFVKRFQVVSLELFEPEERPEIEDIVEEITVPNVEIFTYRLVPLGIRFEWERPSADAFSFEIRKGVDWETGSRQIVTTTLSAILEGQAVGDHMYWIRAFGLDGTPSESATPLLVTIPPLGEVDLDGYVVDNFVMLQWTNPTSAFQIEYYIVSKNGTQVGEQQGTFITLFEDTGGTYTYSVRAVDIFGNVSNDATLDLLVSQPADYVLYDIYTDDFTGTKVNVYRDATLPSIFASLNLNETWQQYADNGYATMQDEINDGLPYWLQPTSPGVGSYERVADFGTILEGIICNVSWAYHEIVPFTQVKCFLSTSLDGIAYTAPVETKSLFLPQFRYVKVRFEFLALN
jgi:hypothetical protein